MVIFSFAFSAGLSFAGTLEKTPTQHEVYAKDLTTSLGVLWGQYMRATPVERERLTDKLVAVAAQRKALLASLIEEHPGKVLELALPERLRSAMPEPVRAMLEERFSMEGELEVLYEDYEDGSYRLLHFLRSNGKRFSLHFNKTPANLLSGTPVSVEGVLVAGSGETDGAVALESEESLTTLAAGDATGSTTVSSDLPTPPLPNTFGEQRTLVILANFQDNPSNMPWSIAEVDSAISGKVSEFFLENSYGQTSLRGDTYGWYTIPLDSTVCDMMLIESAARSAATTAGVDLSAYAHHVYVFPKTTSCGWSGTSTVGGSPSRTWINGDLRLEIVGHELGHGMGLSHSHSLVCQDAAIGTDCKKLEYGDGIDIMGWSSSAHFNTFHKERLGWLNNGISPPITRVDADGVYVLEPYASIGSSPKALKIYKGIDPTTGKRVWYYIEYRQAVGFDSGITKSALLDSNNILNGVVIRTGSPEQSGNTSYLLDMTPDTYQLYTIDPALIAGRSFSDPEAGVTITTLWADGNTAGVDVRFETSPCAHANPLLTFSPAQSQITPGATTSYNVTVTNNDSPGCGASDFNLTAAVPDGWTATFADPVLSIGGGSTASTTLAVIASASAPDGFYGIDITAKNSSDAAYYASGSASCEVKTVIVPNKPGKANGKKK